MSSGATFSFTHVKDIAEYYVYIYSVRNFSRKLGLNPYKHWA